MLDKHDKKAWEMQLHMHDDLINDEPFAILLADDLINF